MRAWEDPENRVFDHPCPACGAGPGEPCLYRHDGRKGEPMEGTHHARDLVNAGVITEAGEPTEATQLREAALRRAAQLRGVE